MDLLNPIYTEKTECQDCYKCLRECMVKAIKVVNGHAQVVPELCILCGHCVDICPVGAKKVRDDLGRVKQLLELRKDVYVSLAPSFVSEFPGVDPLALVSVLRSFGFRGVSETALGAEEVSAYVAEHLAGEGRNIVFSSACPSAVEYVKKYHPEHGARVTDLLSPLLVHACMLKQLYGEGIGIVFVGPCISKKREADLHPGLVDVAVTFKDLRRWLEEERFDLARIEPGEGDVFVPERSHEGSLYPIDGGMVATIKRRASFERGQFMAFSGIADIRDALDEISLTPLERPVFAELLACEGGCVNGPQCSSRRGTIRKRVQIMRYADLASPERRPRPGTDPRTTWDIEAAPPFVPREEDIRDVLAKIGKYSREDELNCGACGYDTCREFASAFLNRKAEQMMCVSYMRKLAQKKANALLRTMPSGVVIVDKDLLIVECNKAFARLLGTEALLLYDAKPGLEGVSLRKMVPFHDHFQAVLETGADILDKDIRYQQKVLHGSIFGIEKNRIAGGIFQDVTVPSIQKDRIIGQAENIIRKHLSTVQKIAFLLGENAAESEVMLNSIIRSFSNDEDRKED